VKIITKKKGTKIKMESKLIRDVLLNILEQIDMQIELSVDAVDLKLSEMDMNSVDFIQMLILIEEKFNIEIPDEYLDINKFNTLMEIETLVKELIERKNG